MRPFTPIALLLAALASACSSQQLYHAGQQWQKTECRKLPASEQPRCLKSTEMSFEAYQQQAAAARSGS